MNTQLSDSFLALVKVMDELREQCPWDKKQTIQSLRPLTIEEMYELTDSITHNNWQGIKEELGDVLLHILFYSKIATEQQQFTLQEVIESITKKLIFRHPHIYGNTIVNNEEDVKRNWEKLKQQEKKDVTNKGTLSGVPIALPAVVKATRIQEKAKQVGFEWDNKEDVFEKIKEEIAELQEAVNYKQQQDIEEEFGDVLFSLINYARFIKVDAEGALEKTNQKFIHRFNQMEKMAATQQKNLSDMSLAEMNALWNIVKKQTQ